MITEKNTITSNSNTASTAVINTTICPNNPSFFVDGIVASLPLLQLNHSLLSKTSIPHAIAPLWTEKPSVLPFESFHVIGVYYRYKEHNVKNRIVCITRRQVLNSLSGNWREKNIIKPSRAVTHSGG